MESAEILIKITPRINDILYISLKIFSKTQILQQKKLIKEWMAEVVESAKIAASSLLKIANSY